MNKAALYVRVSTSHQIDKDSLPFQRQDLTNYTKYALGIDEYEIFEDAGYSGKNTERPKYQEMINRINSGEFSHLLVWKIDRISRNLKDFTEMYDDLKSKGVTFISKNEQFDTSSAMGEAMLKIILVFAELERKLTAERVFSIMLSRAEKGLWNGATIPLGYKWSEEAKFPIVDEIEAEVVKSIFALYEKIGSTYKVAHELNDKNYKTKRGGKWVPKTVSGILRNPFYIGTYRYNTKDSKRRWKDEKEWIVVDDNHNAIISKEQFQRVNDQLTKNFHGSNANQRRNSNIHIFSGILTCGKCNSSLISGLDVARSDGYRPSRYYCYSSVQKNTNSSCSNFISDITLLPFILNYISNFINLQNNITSKHSLRDIERALLRGINFVDVDCINRKGLEDTLISFAVGLESHSYNHSHDNGPSIDLELDSLKREKKKYESAIQRLEDLFLFSSDAMSNKDFMFKKRDLLKNLDRINNELATLNKKNINSEHRNNFAFLNKASDFLIQKELKGKRDINFRELLDAVDKSLVKNFIMTIIEEIIVEDKRIQSITFHNGITHKFLYKAKDKQINAPKQRFLYRSYEPMVMNLLEENKSVSRIEVEKLTGLKRSSAATIIMELIAKGIIEKRGNSTATRYYLIKKKTT